MKQLLLLVFLMSTAIFSFGQSATSISNGNWISPATWQGGVVPITGYDVIINHDVTLGMSWGYTSGSITINQGGSLTQSTTGLNMLVADQGVFTNHGTFIFSKFALTSSTNCSNSGTLDNIDSLYISCNFVNSGTINAYDLLPDRSFTNSGTVNATNFYNNGILTNTGNIITVNIYNNDTLINNNSISFYDHTNAYYLVNYGNMSGTGNMHNHGRFFNQNTGNISVDVDFSNVDTVYHDAYFENNGLLTIGLNMSNFDTLAGSTGGQFCIAQLSYNSGIFTGSFDFCDNTPPPTAPFIDYNSGTVGTGITWCITPCGSGINDDNNEPVFTVYPNPSSFFNIENPYSSPAEFSIYLPDGRLVAEYKLLSSGRIVINDFPAGLYLYSFNGIKNFNGKLIRL